MHQRSRPGRVVVRAFANGYTVVMRSQRDGLPRVFRARDHGEHIARCGFKLVLHKRKMYAIHTVAHHLRGVFGGNHKARDAAKLQLFIAQVPAVGIRGFKRIIMQAAHHDERRCVLFTQQAVSIKRNGVHHHRGIGKVSHADVILRCAALGIIEFQRFSAFGQHAGAAIPDRFNFPRVWRNDAHPFLRYRAGGDWELHPFPTSPNRLYFSQKQLRCFFLILRASNTAKAQLLQHRIRICMIVHIYFLLAVFAGLFYFNAHAL